MRRILPALLPTTLLLCLPAILLAQTTVRGTVSAADGDPLVGAQVSVVGTDVGAVTDREGEYQIGGVPPGRQEFRVTFLGYRDERRAVDVTEGTNVINFVLYTAPIEQEAIIVTGTAGAVQRRSVGNAISKIDASEVLEKAPVIDMADLLTARSAGAFVTTTAGTPGAGSRIRLRGISSVTQSNEPLIYVDGVRIDNDPQSETAGFTVGGQSPSRINDIDPEDIESIEIIKGPAAATLYGTEAAAGVIQIITKKGRFGETRWNIRSTVGQTDLNNIDFPENFGSVHADSVPVCRAATIGDVEVSESDCGLSVVRTLSNGRLLIAQNPLDVITGDGTLQDHSISVSGGREDFTFYVSGNIQSEGSSLPANWTEKYGARANFQWNQSEIFDLAVSTGYTNNEIRLPNSDNNIFGFFGNAFLANPGRIRATSAGVFAFGEPFTPLERVSLLDSRFTNDRFTGSVVANFNPLSWFHNRATFGLDLNAEENTQFAPFGALASLNALGQRANDRQTVFNISFDYNGTVTWDATQDIRLNTSVGTQVYNENTDTVGAFGRDFPGPGVSTVSAAGTRLGTETRVEETSVGVYVQEQVGWKNRVFVTGAVRFDDHSSFGDDFDFETYPKVSASWVIDEEPWFEVPLISSLKLRAAYGFAGRQPAAFSEFREFAPTSIRAGVPAAQPNQIGNPNLGPERSNEFELGFDANLWNDRIGVELTYYDKNTNDALLNVPNIPSLGFPGSQLFNVGEVDNYGWEFGVNGLVVDTDIADVELNLAMATNENELTDLAGIPSFEIGFAGGPQRVEEGECVAGFWARVIEGRNDDGSPIISADRQFLGCSTPGFWGSFGGTVTLWDNLRFYTLFDWKSDYSIYNNTADFKFSSFINVEERLDPDILATQEVQDKLALNAVGSDFAWIEEGDFVKLREISVSYTLPERLTQAIQARRAVITGSARNLKTWTDYSGVDPELNVFGATNLTSADFLTVPQARRFLLTLDLSY